MKGTEVIANQGGCTCWCNDCGESHNCESWSTEKTRNWMRTHQKECAVGREATIRQALEKLKSAGVPAKMITPVKKYADSLRMKK